MLQTRPSATPPLSPSLTSELLSLVRGSMLIHGSGKRASTARTYRSGRTALAAFCEPFGLPPLPLSPQALQLWVTHGLATRKLDSSTVKLRVLAVGDVYDYCRSHLHMRHLRSPLRDPQIVELLRVVGVNFKKPGGGSIAISAAELYGLFAHGFVSSTRRGRWARNFAMFLNFGMLRQTAVHALVIVYELDETGSVRFLPGSDIQLYHHPQFGASCLEVCISSDKNMNAQKAAREGRGRSAFIPYDIPKLGVSPGADLLDYLRTERPRSGGRLFAYPHKRGSGFAEQPTSVFNSMLRAAYRRAFPSVSQEYLRLLGSHSGRKTLAQLLWDRGFSRRLIADAGGWFLKKEAMDLYFKTAAHVILTALAGLSADSMAIMPFVTLGD